MLENNQFYDIDSKKWNKRKGWNKRTGRKFRK